MFRITRFMQEIRGPSQDAPRRAPAGPVAPVGPVVIWNLVRRCNLTCRHCYSISADVDFPGELTTPEIFRTMDDLAAFRVPALILSGGEPLLHPDIFTISRRAKATGFFVGLSTNGTLIDAGVAARIAEVGYDYVGISLDGRRATHDRFRRKEGAFDASLAALRLLRDAGVRVGVRFTLTQENAVDLPALLALLDDEAIDRFYLSHLNYAGRGDVNRRTDAALATTRRAMDLLFETCWWHLTKGRPKEFVTGNNDADGVYLLQWTKKRFPERAAYLEEKLREWGGNASGVAVANIDNLGNVHPDTFWWDRTLGNVKERSFAAIWADTSDPLLAGLKQRPRAVGGRCGACAQFAICGGNTRVRAWRVFGDPWAEDPACYLDDDELGIAPGHARLPLAPYARPRRSAKVA